MGSRLAALSIYVTVHELDAQRRSIVTGTMASARAYAPWLATTLAVLSGSVLAEHSPTRCLRKVVLRT
jgi:hypothetical protein